MGAGGSMWAVADALWVFTLESASMLALLALPALLLAPTAAAEEAESADNTVHAGGVCVP